MATKESDSGRKGRWGRVNGSHVPLYTSLITVVDVSEIELWMSAAEMAVMNGDGDGDGDDE